MATNSPCSIATSPQATTLHTMATTSNGFVFVICFALLMAMAAATQFRVGGSTGWTVPSDPDTTPYNRWAQRNRFRIGDSLLFVYQLGGDSVLQVSQDAYDACNVSAPLGRYDNGNTVFALDRSGPFYFISGVAENCLKNEKLIVVVLADRTNRASTTMPPSPPPTSSSPSLSPTTAPLPPPTSSSPSPSQTTAPSPPPTPTPSLSSSSPQPTMAPSPPPPSSSTPPPTPASSSPSEITPSPTPSPPTNGASLKVVGFTGTVGVLLGSMLVM